jgi:hypothetical protein
VAENCSTADPYELVPLHPVQLVSMVTLPGEMDKLPPDPPAVPPPQPASASNGGTSARARARSEDRPGTANRGRPLAASGQRFPLFVACKRSIKVRPAPSWAFKLMFLLCLTRFSGFP